MQHGDRAHRQRRVDGDRAQVGVVVGDRVREHGGQRGAPDDLDQGLDRVRLYGDPRSHPVPREVGVHVPSGHEVVAEQRQFVPGQVTHRDRGGGTTGRGVRIRAGSRTDDQAQSLDAQRSRADAGWVGAGERDAQVELVGGQPGFDPVLGGLHDVQGDPGMPGVHLLGQWADQVRRQGRRHRQPQAAAREVGHVVHGTLGGGQVAQRSARVVQVDLAHVGGAHRAAGAVEQLHAQRAFELPDLLGQRRL